MLKFNLDTNAPSFEKEVRAFLGYMKMSQAELAKCLQVSPQYISAILKKRKNPEEFKRKIAEKLEDILENL